jgi:type IV pilus assembly protein PilX
MRNAHTCTRPHAQRGVVMLFGLIALAIMLIGAAAMVRSMNNSMFSAGNLGFKRDMANQMERAVDAVSRELSGGTLATETTRQASVTASNYSATLLASNAQGIPTALLSDTAFAGVANSSNDITVSGQGITVRYVIDRMCASSGAADSTHCTMADDPVAGGGGGSGANSAAYTTSGGSGAIKQRVVYRLSIRVTGPRSTQAFFQSTMTL